MNNEQTIEKILLESKKLEDVVNTEILTKFATLHNINKKNSTLSIKQEMIAKRTIFLDVKKHYALFIVNKEGKPCEQYEIRGMVTRRSDYPYFTRQKIHNLLDIIIREEIIDFKKINNFIEQTTNEAYELVRRGEKTVAKTSVYNDNYKNNKDPYQVNAMKLWNNIEYDYFVYGTRGYLFKILGIDFTIAPQRVVERSSYLTAKNKHIVVPFEVEKLPEYYVIDVEGMVKYCWIDRVKEILRALQGEKYYINDENDFGDFYE